MYCDQDMVDGRQVPTMLGNVFKRTAMFVILFLITICGAAAVSLLFGDLTTIIKKQVVSCSVKDFYMIRF